jgi:fibronectin-binding autotransporter adhesin
MVTERKVTVPARALLPTLLLLLSCAFPLAQGATKTWDAGGTAGDWSSVNNWSGNTAPLTTDDILFDNSGGALENVFLNGARTVNSLILNLTAVGNQTWDLGADDSTSPFTLTLATGSISVLSTSGSGTYTIGATSGTLIGTGVMTLVTSGAGFTFDNSRSNGGLLQINAIVSGSTKTLTKTGAGIVVLSGTNTYTGATTISLGTLRIGASDRIADGSALSVSGTFDLQTFNETVASVTLVSGSITGTGTATLTSAASFDLQSGTITAILAGTVALNKTTSGTVTLGGANTYTGATTVSLGTLQISATDRIANAGALTVSGGTFGLQTFNETVASVTLVSGSITGTGTATLTSTAAFDLQSGNVTAILAGTEGLNKTTSGTVTLGGANTYTGATTVSLGTLQISASDRIANTSALTVSGGTFDLQTFNETVASVTLTSGSIIGSGTLTPTGAFDLQSGNVAAILGGSAKILNKTTSGTVTLGGANTYTGATNVNAGTLQITANERLSNSTPLNVNGGIFDLQTFNETVSTVTLVSGSITGTGTATLTSAFGFDVRSGNVTAILAGTAYPLTKTTSGTVTLGGANTYTGDTNINAGILQISASERIANTGTLNVFGGAFDLQTFNQTLASVTLYSGSITGTGTATLTSASTFQLQSGTVTAILAGTVGLNKTNTGTVILGGANTYTGATTVGIGTLQISANERIANASALTVSGGIFDLQTFNETVASVSLSGGGSITGTGSATLTSTSSFDLQEGTVTAILAGSGSLTKTVSFATVTLGGANTYSGGTNVNAGLLQISASERIANGSALTVSGGTFGLQAFNETVASVTLVSGSITGSGTLTTTSSFDFQSGSVSAILAGTGPLTKTTSSTVTLGGVNTYTGGTTINGGTLVATNVASLGATSGSLTLNAGTFEISGSFTSARNITLGNVASTFQIDPSQTYTSTGIISGSGTLNNTGAGTLVLSGANTYTGATVLSAGVTNLQNATGLGTTAGGTTISYYGTLQLQNNITVGNEALIIEGDGAFGQSGALVNVSGTNNYGGLITFPEGSGTISSDSGTLNLTNTGTMTGPDVFLTLTGSGDGTVSSIIGTGGGFLIKSGTGTWTISGANTYTGETEVTAGILNIRNSAGLGTTAGGTTIYYDSTLQLQGNITIGNEALFIEGEGTGAQTGALVNVSGTNNYGGLITLAEGITARISSDSGTLNLTNTGTITGTDALLNLTGSGNGTLSGVLASVSGVNKSGTGTWTLFGANTYTGSTDVQGGTLTLAASSGSALGSTSAIIVDFGGTLLLGADNQINNSATMALGEGTFAKGNFSEGSTSTAGLGALTLVAVGAHLDFGTGTVGTLTFASFDPNGFVLTIDNWTSGMADRLIFGSDQTSNLSSFSFTGYDAGAVEFSLGGGFYEVTAAGVAPVPEPSTYGAGALALTALVYHQRRRLRR